MPGGKKGDPPEVPLRRSSRERKRATFGSDFEQDNPETVNPKPSKRAKKDDATPGTSADPTGEPTGDLEPQPPLPSLDPKPKTVTWPSEPEFWKKPQLPTNHSKGS